jgi:hypothetical protein
MKKTFALLCVFFTLAFGTQAQAVPVNLELGLLVDVSGSVDATEYALQKTGYINAFNNIASFGPFNPFAVSYIEWSGASQQLLQVGWTLISNATDAASFATAIGATSRAFSGNTAPGSAINFVVPLFSGNGFEGTRQIIDVSGDGAENDGAVTSTARDNALLAGINQINGLPILGETGLLAFYTNDIKGGTGSFVTAAASFADFENAVFNKLQQEIVPSVPEPATMTLMGIGALGAAFMRRRRMQSSN